MTESAGKSPEPRKCKWEQDSEPLYDTMDEALLRLDEKQKAEKVSFADVIPLHPVAAPEESAPKEVIVKIGKLHAVFWFLIVLSGIVWSFLFAAAIFTGFGSAPVSLFGVLGTLALAATVFSLSKDNVVIHTVKEDQEAKP